MKAVSLYVFDQLQFIQDDSTYEVVVSRCRMIQAELAET